LDTIVFFSEIIDGYKTLGTKVYFRVRVRDISALLRTSLQSPGTTPGFGFAQTTPHRDVSATPPAVATTTPLGSAHARLALEFPADGVIPVTPTRRPTRHVNTAHKEIEWSLRARERHIIIGDSNLSRFPPFQHPSLQVDSFPGATFAHAASILAKTTVTPDVHKVVLAFGLNDRSHPAAQTGIRNLVKTLKMARAAFPRASGGPLVSAYG
jgi:hypothetical protein